MNIKEIITKKRDGLELDPESRLYKLGKKLNML